MPPNGRNLFLDLRTKNATTSSIAPLQTATSAVVEWDWEAEHADRKLEAKADTTYEPFQVDRMVLKDVVRENLGVDVGRINFLSLGTFHKAYLVTLVNTATLVARVARRFIPRLKTESEVATLQYLREHTSVPVPTVYHYDSDPYNRLGGEYILMSKAPGIPLSKVYHSMAHSELVRLLENLAYLVIPLFSHRFHQIGSLYSGNGQPSSTSTPKASHLRGGGFSVPASLYMSGIVPPLMTPKAELPKQPLQEKFHVGPIISWPFFGSNRGELTEIDRGPWSTTESYLISCAQREIDAVIRENEGKAAPHRLHLDPDEIRSSRHHHMKAVPGDESDDSDEWDLQESEDEWEGPGDAMYRDYRRMQRSTFLVAHMAKRVESVRQEMQRWIRVMGRLVGGTCPVREEFGLDCHDLSLENIFVDEEDPSKITCIIDWESTSIRPLWACAHLPAFLQSSPFTADLFRDIVAKLFNPETLTPALPGRDRERGQGQHQDATDLASTAQQWLLYEAKGIRLRMAHRCVEWDGWEEGLVESILGPEEQEEEWFRDLNTQVPGMVASPGLSESSDCEDPRGEGGENGDCNGGDTLGSSLVRRKPPFARLPVTREEKEKVQMLDTTGDVCGGRGGELGRRLEALLQVNDRDRDIVGGRRWMQEENGGSYVVED